MPIINYHRDNGLPIIDVTVRYHALHGIAHPTGGVPEVRVRALIDTGATNVVLCPNIVAELGLPFAANINNTIVGGETHRVPAHAGDLVFGNECNYTVTDVLMLSQQLIGSDMIIGWDALRFTDWEFARDGSFSQAW